MELPEQLTPEGFFNGGISSVVKWVLGGTVGAFVLDTVLQRTGKSSIFDILPDSVKNWGPIKTLIDGWNSIVEWCSNKLDSILQACGLKSAPAASPAPAAAPAASASQPNPTVTPPGNTPGQQQHRQVAGR